MDDGLCYCRVILSIGLFQRETGYLYNYLLLSYAGNTFFTDPVFVQNMEKCIALFLKIPALTDG